MTSSSVAYEARPLFDLQSSKAESPISLTAAPGADWRDFKRSPASPTGDRFPPSRPRKNERRCRIDRVSRDDVLHQD